LPDLADWKLRADMAEACPKLAAERKLSSRPVASANASSLSLGRPLLPGAAFALVKEPVVAPPYRQTFSYLAYSWF
jgi:hypothetical protein